jgi:hypothetical protein
MTAAFSFRSGEHSPIHQARYPAGPFHFNIKRKETYDLSFTAISPGTTDPDT